MDIWAWVHEAQEELKHGGQERLAEIVETLPSLVVDGQHAQAEALLPEGLALARAIDHPWLEVFLRHWLAQSRILHRCDVTQGMDEVVRLLDFAHGERTASCPQSVCVTQDFCNAYDKLDGPGYAVERVAASNEALARIDASWPCFTCISVEHSQALLDLGRYADAETFMRRQLAAAGHHGDEPALVLQLADVLGRLGRHADAVELLDALDTSREQKSTRLEHAQLKTLAYARTGRVAEAVAIHPAPAELEPSDFVRWLHSEQALCAALPERNDAKLGRTLREFCNTLRANGSLYQQAEIAVAAAKLALERGRPRVAALHLEQVSGLLPQLRRPDAIARAHAELQARISPEHTATNADESQLIEGLAEDPEANYEVLCPARAANPSSENLVLATCRALQEMGFPEHAVRNLEDFVKAQPASTAVFYELMRLLVNTGAETRLRALADTVPESLQAGARFYLGRMMIRRENWSAAAQAFERTRELEDSPQRSTLSNLALAYRHLGRLEESLALLDELAQDEEDHSDDWDRMYVATLLGRHDKVRDSARRLGFKFDGEGPIDDPWEYCNVKLRDSVGRDVSFRAVRINPVVARIIAMQAPDQPCRYQDEILIDPVLLNPRDEEAAKERPGDEDDYVREFRGDQLLKAGGYRIYDLDGIHPGEEALEALSQAFVSRGMRFSQRSGDAYQLTPREGEPSVTGVYIFIAVPQEVATAEVYATFSSVTGAWSTPLTCRGLLRELGNETELARHEQIAQDLKL